MSRQERKLQKAQRKEKFAEIGTKQENCGCISNTKKKRQQLKERQRQEKGGAPITLEDGTRINCHGDVIVEHGQGKKKDKMHKQSTRGLGMFQAARVREENGYKIFRSQCNVKMNDAKRNHLKQELISSEVKAMVFDKQPLLPDGGETTEMQTDKINGARAVDVRKPHFKTDAYTTLPFYNHVLAMYEKYEPIKKYWMPGDYLLYNFIMLELFMRQSTSMNEKVLDKHQSIFEQARLPRETWDFMYREYASVVSIDFSLVELKPYSYRLHGSPVDLFETFALRDVGFMKKEPSFLRARDWDAGKNIDVSGRFDSAEQIGIPDIVVNEDTLLREVSNWYPDGTLAVFKGMIWILAASVRLMRKCKTGITCTLKVNAQNLILRLHNHKESKFALFGCQGDTQHALIRIHRPNKKMFEREVLRIQEKIRDPLLKAPDKPCDDVFFTSSISLAAG